jgi:glycosyltransferase involved in cell wall biosynthesis
VALEAIACGCAVIGSSEGGLKDAIGSCGLTFPNNDVSALVDCINRMISAPDLKQYTDPAREHLNGHRRRVVAQRYLEVLQEALN